MQRFFVLMLALCGISVAAAEEVTPEGMNQWEWYGIAVSQDGRVFQSSPSADRRQAVMQALHECKRRLGDQNLCSEDKTLAALLGDYVSIFSCLSGENRRQVFVASDTTPFKAKGKNLSQINQGLYVETECRKADLRIR